MLKPKSFILFAAAILLYCHNIYAQSSNLNRTPITKNAPKTTISFNLQKQPGIGPSGHISTGISSFNPDSIKNEGERGYPKVKNKPVGLHDETHYFYILDDFQFHYQNYCAGIFSKDYFLNKVESQKWNLADTIKLSRNVIKCGFSVLVGYNNDNEAVYIIDVDGDNDFGNDVLKPLQKTTYFTKMDGASSIVVEYKSSMKIKQDKILVLPIDNSRSPVGKQQIDLSFSFPEFRYARFSYQGIPYLICTDAVGMKRPFIHVIPDIPKFSNADHETKVTLNQLVRIGNKEFMFTGYEDNGNKISLTADNIHDFSSAKPTVAGKLTKSKVAGKLTKPTPERNTAVFSNQAGYKAPIIKGYDINTEAKELPFISTADLKGKYVFVDFWSTNCAPCIAEFPHLKEVYLKYDRKDFEIIGILDERERAITERLIKEGKLIWPNIKTNTKGTDINGYIINSYPTSYLIDPEGVIIAVNLTGEALSNKLKTLIK